MKLKQSPERVRYKHVERREKHEEWWSSQEKRKREEQNRRATPVKVRREKKRPVGETEGRNRDGEPFIVFKIKGGKGLKSVRAGMDWRVEIKWGKKKRRTSEEENTGGGMWSES